MFQQSLQIEIPGRGLHDVTGRVAAVVVKSGVQAGLCHVFVQHTSASLVIQENADPSVLRDLERWLSDLAPEGRPWEHADEGPDDMPAHAKGAVTRTSELIPVVGGRLGLGVWQALYLWEHRAHPRPRQLVISVF